MGHGGTRAGAGRKPRPRTVVRRVMAEQILSAIDELSVWHHRIDVRRLMRGEPASQQRNAGNCYRDAPKNHGIVGPHLVEQVSHHARQAEGEQ